MSRVLLAGSRAWTATTRDAVATVWGRGTAVLVSGAYPTGADRIAEKIGTLAPDLHGGLCAGHPYPSLWDVKLDGVRESAAQRAQRHREAQTICRRCPIMAACLSSRTGNPQLGGGVWGGEVFQEKESTAGEPAPPALTEQQAQRTRTECLADWRQPHPSFRQPGGDNRRSGLTNGRSA